VEMAPGALPRPGRVPEQRLLSPKIHRWRWRSCGTLSRNLLIPLGFSIERLFIGEGASSGVDQGGITTGGRGQRLGRAPSWWHYKNFADLRPSNLVTKSSQWAVCDDHMTKMRWSKHSRR
jgi:hypothetical protein